MSAMLWYALHTYSGQEAKVKAYIEDLIERQGLAHSIGQVLVPSQEIVQVRGGRKIRQVRRDFPSYVIVEMHDTKEVQHSILGIPGVTGFVGVNGKASPLRKAEVDRILGRLGHDRTDAPAPGAIIQIPWKRGDSVRINEGPFKDFDGVIEDIHPDKGKLRVMVSVFGRSTPVELDFRQVGDV